MGINNPFTSKDGFGAQISDEGILSKFRWYDPLLLAGTGVIGAQVIAAREGPVASAVWLGNDLMKDAELPGAADRGTGKAKPPPSLSDELVMFAARAERDRLKTKRGRAASFVTQQEASTYLGG